jgi:hypothetical protein
MLRRLLLSLGVVLIGVAVVCAGVVGVSVVRLIYETPPANEGVQRLVQLQPWVLAFFGCALAGFIALWFVRDRGKQAIREP